MFIQSDDPWAYEDPAPLPSRLPSQAEITAGLTPAQADAASHDGAILVLAGAGTGKTRTLTAASLYASSSNKSRQTGFCA